MIYGRDFVCMDHLIDVEGLKALHGPILDGISACPNAQPVRYNESVQEPRGAGTTVIPLFSRLTNDWTPDALTHFAGPVEWLKALPIFAPMTRATLFITDAGCRTAPHADFVNIGRHQHELVWLRTTMDKVLYVNGTPVQGYSAFFDDADMHSAEALHQSGFAIRMDGVFPLWVRQAIGVPEDPWYSTK